MTEHENFDNSPENRYASQALALAAELRTKEAVYNPDPEKYRTAGKLLSLYFSSYSPGEDPEFHYVLDGALSALDAMYIRDENAHRSAVAPKVGEHPADMPLMQALQLARDAQVTVEAGALDLLPYSSAETQSIIDELVDHQREGLSPADTGTNRGVRFRAASTLERAAFAVRDNQEVLPQLAQIGNYASLAMFGMADVVTRHANDMGDVGRWNRETKRLDIEQGDIPLYKDAIARDVSTALQTAYSTE